MKAAMFAHGVVLAGLCQLLAACQDEKPGAVSSTRAPAPQESPADPGPSAPVGQVVLEDVVETRSDYVLGISYPPVASKYPGLAAELKRYSDARRAELMDAVAKREAGPGAPLYDLTLAYTGLLETPDMVVVAADGSTYTGGESSRPLVARFVWLPKQNRLLTASDLVPESDSWNQIAADVRRQLHAALAQRAEADDLPPAEQAQLLRSAGARIDAGTTPDARHFAMFEPVLSPQGKLSALRFVFPAEQLNTGLNGTQTVEVPAHVLLPHVAPQYRPLFGEAAG